MECPSLDKHLLCTDFEGSHSVCRVVYTATTRLVGPHHTFYLQIPIAEMPAEPSQPIVQLILESSIEICCVQFKIV